MWLRKEKAGNAPGYTWENDGDVLEVPDELGLDLVAIPDGGFSEAAPPDDVPDPAPSEEDEDAAVVTEISEAPSEDATAEPAKATPKPSTRRSGTK